uniref:Cyclic nucleotide-binding domain-containing protein n=1 Tax=Macrostomum lignano TaxID=282301 RepID=A0A1I8FXG6_9PLAT
PCRKLIRVQNSHSPESEPAPQPIGVRLHDSARTEQERMNFSWAFILLLAFPSYRGVSTCVRHSVLPMMPQASPAHIYTRAAASRSGQSRTDRSLLRKMIRQQTIGSAPYGDSDSATALIDRSESLPVDDFGLRLLSKQSAATSGQHSQTPPEPQPRTRRPDLKAMRAFKSLDTSSSVAAPANSAAAASSSVCTSASPPNRKSSKSMESCTEFSGYSSQGQKQQDSPSRNSSKVRRWPSLRSRIGSRLGSLRRQQTLQQNPSLQSLQQPSNGLQQQQQQQCMQPDCIEKCDSNSQLDDAAVLETGCELPEDQKQSTSSYLKEQFFAFFQPSDNKLAMKLFGNKNALLKEKQRQQQSGKWIIHPCSNFRSRILKIKQRRVLDRLQWKCITASSFVTLSFYWDLLMLILLITNLVVLPVAISFFNDDLSAHWIIFNCLSDTIFLSDIAVNFRTGVITNDFADEIILDPKLIAQHYVKSWFFLDLVSSIPMDYIFLALNQRGNVSQLVHAGRALRILRLAKLLSLLRLLRLSRLVRYVSQWEECLGIVKLILIMLLLGHWNACLQFLVPFLNDFPDDSWVTKEGLKLLNIANKFIGIFNLVLLMLLLAHWNACLQFLIPLLQDFPDQSWVAVCNLKFLVPSIQDFPKDSWVRKLNIQDAHWFRQYTWALFKAMSHMLSIGYGQHPPTSISEAWITIVSMMTGSSCYALFVGHAAALIQSFDTSKRMYREKFKQVEEYMAYRKLPRALRQRIANYYEHRYQGKMFNENDILSELSECLREQIINYNCRALVAAVPFFTYADQDFVSEVVTRLKYEVFQPGDLIIKEGTIGTKMYFIQEGIVDIITKDGEVATSLSDGSYFGEICLLTNARRVASVRAETYCNLYSLERENFLSVLDNYPLMRRTMESVAAERLSKIGQNPQLVSNRADLKEDLNLVKEIVDQAAAAAAEEADSTDNSDDCDGGHSASSSYQRSRTPTPTPAYQQKPSWEATTSSGAALTMPGGERRKSVVRLGLEKLGIARNRFSGRRRHHQQQQQGQQQEDQEGDESQAQQVELEPLSSPPPYATTTTCRVEINHE